MKRSKKRALAVGAAISAASAAEAATFQVLNTNDDGAGSLRQAIADANLAAGADTITFDAAVTGTITLTTGHIVISDSVDIQGPGRDVLTVSGNNASRIFYVYDVTTLAPHDVTITGLTLANGYSYVPEDSLISRGAAINVIGENLTLIDSAVIDSTSGCSGGGIAFSGYENVESSEFVEASLTITNSVLSGNTSGVPDQQGAGGAIYVSYAAGVTITDTQIINNTAYHDGGGLAVVGMQPYAEIDITGSTISDNTIPAPGEEPFGFGGGIAVFAYAPITIDETTISGNDAIQYGGGLFAVSATVTLTNSTVAGNYAPEGGGGVTLWNSYGSEIRNSTIYNNSTYRYGGGIYLYSSELLLAESTVSTNSAGVEGGGLYMSLSLANVTGSIIAGNTGTTYNDIYLYGNNVLNIDHTLIQDPGTVTYNDLGGNIVNDDPELGPLQDNGGPTETMKPAATSPAVDAIDPAEVTESSRDQRGFTRPVGFVDMGAVELNPGTIQFAVAAESFNENAGAVTVSVTRTGGSDGAASVQLSVVGGGSATGAGVDYTLATLQLDWLDGDDTPKLVNITLNDDNLFEGDESFTLQLGSVTGASLGTQTTETVTITDNETQPTFSIAPVSDTEGHVGTKTFEFTVTLSGPSASPTSVNYTTTPNDATEGDDYEDSSGTLNFPATTTSMPINVTVNGDTDIETDETFDVELSGASGAGISPSAGSAIGTIQNDDFSAGTMQFADDAEDVNEAAGTITIFVTRTGGSFGEASVQVNVGVASTATGGGTDYTFTGTTLNWGSGDAETKSFTIPINNDTLDEPNETIVLELGSATGAAIGSPAAETVTILDDDVAGTLQFADDAEDVNEGAGTITIFVTRTGGSDGAASVQVSVGGTSTASGGGVDYTFTGTTLNWDHGDAATKSFSIPITNDTLDESGETIVLELGSATGAIIGTPQTETVTIVDNDVPGTVQFADDAEDVSEGAGSITIFVNRTGGSDGPASVQVSVSGTSTASGGGTDYTFAGTTLNWADGDTAPKSFAIPINNDPLDEPNETIVLQLGAATGASIGSPATETVTILDNEFGTLQFADDAEDVNEAAGSITIFVNRTGGADGAASVQVSVSGTSTASGGGTDYTFAGTTLNWADGDAAPKSFAIPINNDTLDEPNETIVLQLSAATGASLGAPATETVTILDNDVPGTVQFADDAEDVNEAAGTITIFVNRTGGSDGAASVQVSVSGTSTASGGGVDYTFAGTTLNWGNGDAAPKSFSIPIDNDTLDEPNETIVLQLSNATTAAIGTPSTETVTILDDDEVVAATADLQTTKSLLSPGPFVIGSEFTFRVRAFNNGPGTATGVSMSDTLPSIVQLVSVTPTQGSCSGTTTIVCNFGTITSGADASVDIVVRAVAPGEGMNSATVISPVNDPAGGNNTGAVAFANHAGANAPALDPTMQLILAALLGATALIVIGKKS